MGGLDELAGAVAQVIALLRVAPSPHSGLPRGGNDHLSKARRGRRSLFEIARETNDRQSEQFIEWFLEEQVEEESTMQDLLQVAERTREIPMLLEEYIAREKAGG